MNKYSEINKILCQKTNSKAEGILNRTIMVDDITMMQLRDILFQNGQILYENLEHNYYIALIPGGFLKKNTAMVLVQLSGREINVAAYAEEGLIKQHTSEGVIDGIEEGLKRFIC